MQIGEVARLAGTTTRTAWFYESVGLPAPGRGANGYRDYTTANGERLRLLIGLRMRLLESSPAMTRSS